MMGHWSSPQPRVFFLSSLQSSPWKAHLLQLGISTGTGSLILRSPPSSRGYRIPSGDYGCEDLLFGLLDFLLDEAFDASDCLLHRLIDYPGVFLSSIGEFSESQFKLTSAHLRRLLRTRAYEFRPLVACVHIGGKGPRHSSSNHSIRNHSGPEYVRGGCLCTLPVSSSSLC